MDSNSGGTATAVTGLVLQTDSIDGNGLDGGGLYYGGNQDGVYVQQGNGAVQFLDDQVYGNNNAGLYLQDGYLGAGVSTIEGGDYYDQTGLYGGNGTGIVDYTASLIENVEVYANHSDGIYDNNNAGYASTPPGQITGNTVFGNGLADIEAHTALVTGNLVYSDVNTGRNALELDGGSTGTGNTVYGSANGIYVDNASKATSNLVYDIQDDGIDYSSYAPAGITDNTIYSTAIGIAGAEYYNGPTIPIDGNLIYQNVSAGISLNGAQGGDYESIVNNTIDEQSAIGIYVGGAAVNTTIENNIIVDVSGPALDIAPTAEGGFFSDYNLFDVGAQSTLSGSTVGTIGIWEGVSYTDLATWYYELGFDQHSQLGNPDFVSDATGVQGFGSPSGQTTFYSSSDVYNTPNFGNPFATPIQQLNSIGAVAGGSLQLNGTWTPANYSGNFDVPNSGDRCNGQRDRYNDGQHLRLLYVRDQRLRRQHRLHIPGAAIQYSSAVLHRDWPRIDRHLDLYRPHAGPDVSAQCHQRSNWRSRYGAVRGHRRRRNSADRRQRQPEHRERERRRDRKFHQRRNGGPVRLDRHRRNSRNADELLNFLFRQHPPRSDKL